MEDSWFHIMHSMKEIDECNEFFIKELPFNMYFIFILKPLKKFNWQHAVYSF